jgi:hypothetical protein
MTQNAELATLAKPTTMRGQALVNRIMRGLLRTPLLCRLPGRRLLVVYVVGRKTGREYVVPVAYARHNGGLLVGTPFGWARNMRTGEPVEIRLNGRRRVADVVAFSSEADVVAAYDVIVRGNHAFAKFNNIGLEADGTPRADDLHRAWALGARAFRLVPQD